MNKAVPVRSAKEFPPLVHRPLVFLFPLAFLLLPSTFATPLALRPEAAIQMALEKNYTISVERISPEIAREGLREAWGEFDPSFRASYSYLRDDNFQLSEPAAGYKEEDWSASLGGKIPWLGTDLSLSVQSLDNRFSFTDWSAENAVDTFAGLTIRQPLLRGFGESTMVKIKIARRNSQIAEERFRQTVIDTITNTITAYQNLYFANKNLEVAENSRDLAAKLLHDNQRRAETGAIAPLDVVLAESELALREQSVVQARRLQRQSEIILAGLISNQAARLLPEGFALAAPDELKEVVVDAALDLASALEMRPDYRETLLEVDNFSSLATSARNDWLPRLDVTGSYGWRGQANGSSGSFDDLQEDRHQAVSAGVELEIPIPNRERTARRAAAYLRRNQAKLRQEALEQTIRLNLETAAMQISTGWQRLQAARKAVSLARLSLQAEEKKFRVGSSTTFVVLRVQQDLSAAEVLEFDALTDYLKALAEYHRQMGRTLQVYGVEIF